MNFEFVYPKCPFKKYTFLRKQFRVKDYIVFLPRDFLKITYWKFFMGGGREGAGCKILCPLCPSRRVPNTEIFSRWQILALIFLKQLNFGRIAIILEIYRESKFMDFWDLLALQMVIWKLCNFFDQKHL